RFQIGNAVARSKLFRHYFLGRGRTFDLAREGLLNEFRRTNSVKSAVDQFQFSIERAIDSKARSALSGNAKRVRDERISYDTHIPYDVTRSGPQMLPIGNGNLRCSAKGNIVYDTQNSRYQYLVYLTFKVRDAFVDARDIHDSQPGNQELPMGRPFSIVASWQKEIGKQVNLQQRR
ncbi:MAG: hypothetical protein AAF562_10370, partial [Pseudomonadota bacterium]